MQVNSTVSFTGKKPPKKPKTKNKGLVTAGYASSLATSGTALAALGLNLGERKLTQLDGNDVIAIKKGIQEGLKDSGLYDEGVRVYRIQENAPKTFIKRAASEFQKLTESENAIGPDEIKKTVNNIFNYGKKDKKALNTMRSAINEGLSEAQVYAGKALNGVPEEAQGAAASLKGFISDLGAKALGLKYKLGLGVDYMPGMNTIFAPNKSLQTRIFHEMGHALSADSAIVKALQKAKPMALMIPGIVLTAALCNKRKTTDEQLPTDGKFQKLKDGIKRNAGKLTALAFVPMLAEEGLASLKGGNIAKNLFKDGKLSKELLNKVRISNASNFAGYLALAAGAVLGTKFAIKVKDKIQAKYEAKQETKYQAKLEKYNQKMAAKETAKALKAAKAEMTDKTTQA